MDSQIKYSYPYGGERVIFEKDEIARIKSLDKQGSLTVEDLTFLEGFASWVSNHVLP
jgi:hypothetical protein